MSTPAAAGGPDRPHERRSADEGGTGMAGGRRLFSEFLLSASLVDREGLREAMTHAERRSIPLADAVVELGLVAEADSYAALAHTAGVALVDLDEVPLRELPIRLVPERVARRHAIVPLREDNRTLTYAVSRPFDFEAERDVEFASGRKGRPILARRSQILAALDRCYPKLGEVERLVARLRSTPPVQTLESLSVAADPDSPVVQLCSQILSAAVDAKASDVHIEPGAEEAAVRYRVSGILEPVLSVPRDGALHLVNRFKVMARTNIAVRHRPQDGAFRVLVAGRPVDVRLSTLPTVHGEKVVMRIIDGVSKLQDIDSLGYDAETTDRLKRALARSDGLILFTGPTATGKTTALYSALNHLRTGRTNIVSVEDPVERYLEGVNQTPVNSKAGTPFAAVLRSVLRQDPNVIMVGEIRDAEVAQIVGQAAYTGHLVLSSLHTIDAASAVSRLQNLGLEPFRIAESLAAVFAQRLVRRLCPQCRQAVPPAEARQLGEQSGIAQVPYRAGQGCEACKRTGYIDRVPIAEVLMPDEALRAAIRDGASVKELRAAMRAAGCRTMREAGLAMVERGLTALSELNRVLSDEETSKPPVRERQRVLVVDDDRMLRTLVRRLLEHEGYEVLEGVDGREAVDLAARERPDLLILDLMMPQMDGYQAIAAVRSRIALATLPVIVLTATTGPDAEQRVLELGADDYLIKPFEPGVLLSRVRAIFRRASRIAA